jgi:hypothetical protein
MFGKADKIEVEILADGTIKITTDPISPANHRSADELLEFISNLTGGEMTRTRRPDKKGHLHKHGNHWHSH